MRTGFEACEGPAAATTVEHAVFMRTEKLGQSGLAVPSKTILRPTPNSVSIVRSLPAIKQQHTPVL
eukprot:CAMPEP_0206524716 /NCGR_PEP_ID=MMETSP0324_2-20121206/68333_1 /ASSEMBLY_ACC=CAM_ASM_000836 /TAXON_ID=2866 /ORGANISM="Crypthecodinium cohnii, Strain Seligo" /LENGTH=65 /DNA_ID=CAMNT_0054019303 /DNA_START=858 /DNA_END=1055 /DNA_ORIENTATION=-